MASKRFLMVPVDSSAARMPLPGVVMASATLLSSARFIAVSLISLSGDSRSIAHRAFGCIGSLSFSPLFSPQDLDAGQVFPFHPLQKRAAGCGHIRELVRHTR